MSSHVPRVSTGVDGLDAVLGGGLPARRLHLVHGPPGAGKTTLALQFLLAGVAAGERVVYVGLSESERELTDIARSHGWDNISGVTILDLQAEETQPGDDASYTFFHPSEIELTDAARTILETLEEVRPTRAVFDSLSELRLIARDSLRYRRQILSLKRYFLEGGCTVLLLDTGRSEGRGEFQLETLTHSVVSLENVPHEYGGTRRRLRIDKLRGVAYEEGHHDFRIRTGGLELFPRLVVEESPDRPTSDELLPSGLLELDTMTGGGLHHGTTTMIIGPSGVGKTTISTLHVLSALRGGQAAAVYLFDEDPGKWQRRAAWLGADPGELRRQRRLMIRHVNPAALSPGELACHIRSCVEHEGVRVVVIDSVNGYHAAMTEDRFLTLHLHELFSYLNQRDVVTIVVAAQSGMLGEALEEPFKLSYLADNVLVLRYFEAFGLVRKALATIKRRTGGHDRFIRELHMGPDGVHVGDPLGDFQGILSGELTFTGREDLLIDAGE
jgi:circadian clock protein KaiC